MEPSHKIAVLLAEYNTLRAEVLAARGNVLQAIGLTVPIVMGLVGLAFSPTLALPRWIIFGIPVAGFFYLCISFVWNEINMHKFTKQLRALEHKINDLADDRLLTWENTQGWRSMWLPFKR
jgi:cyanate permease